MQIVLIIKTPTQLSPNTNINCYNLGITKKEAFSEIKEKIATPILRYL